MSIEDLAKDAKIWYRALEYATRLDDACDFFECRLEIIHVADVFKLQRPYARKLKSH